MGGDSCYGTRPFRSVPRLMPQQQTFRSCRRLAGLVLLAAAMAGCAPPAGDVDVEFRIPVEAAEVVTGTVEELVVATGTLRAREIVTLNIETPGLLQIGRDDSGQRLAEGTAVTAGQTIARVTGEDARLHAGLESARRSLDSAKAQLDRRRELFDDKLASEEEMQQAEESYETARLNYERSSLNAAKATLATPIDGTILRLARDANDMPLADGQLVSAGFAVAEIAPLDELIADVDLIGPELARVQPGLATRIRHYAFQDIAIAGEVIRLSPVMDRVRHTFRAEVAVANDGMLLRPGMFVEVTVVVERREDVSVAPRQAVADRAGKSVVFMLDGQRVSRREVRLGLGDDDQVQILDGLSLGDRIVVRGLETLTDGARVRVIGS